MDFADTLAELNITLGDSDDVTFTPEEKTRALQKAWKDPYVVKRVVDSTQTFTLGVNRQALPATLTTITGISLSPSNNLSADFPSYIDSDLYDVVDGYIVWKNLANSIIPTGYTLYLVGNYKYDYTSDTITNTNMQEYIIALAGVNTLTALGYKKANLFLKNDLTMSELIALRRELAQEVIRLRGGLTRSFEG
jgi:hypothetical protein